MLEGTFAFHPMLGFRRKKKAQSIAHGWEIDASGIRQVETDYFQKPALSRTVICNDGGSILKRFRR